MILPTQEKERVVSIDIMRGFALLGIFVVNMLFFHGPYIYVNPYTWYQNPQDYEAFKWIDIFVQGSVYPLFAMLFGYGLAMQFTKSEKAGTSFAKLAVRRLLILLGIGCIHAFLIWSGDILITYAIAGLLLVLLMSLKPLWLFVIGAVLFLLPNSLLLGLVYLGGLIDPDALTVYAGIQEVEASILAYSEGSWGEIIAQNFADWWYMNQWGVNILTAITNILPFLMIGAAASKLKLIERAKELKIFWIITVLVSFIVGTYIKWLPFTTEANLLTSSFQDLFGGSLQAIAYGGFLALICSVPVVSKILSPIGKVGRMSMTIYLMQSIIATTILYSYGFALYGRIDVGTGTWLAIGIYVLQVIFAEIWFTKFKQGPVEFLWRKLTYSNSLIKKDENNVKL